MLTIYIADDSTEVRKRLVALISVLQGIVFVGQTGDARVAIEEIQRLEPEVAILDIRLVNGNGIEVLEIVKLLKAAPLVIMLTAFPSAQYRRRCISAGADYFFDKTSEFEQIIDVLKEKLHRKTPAG
jgi:two-component system, NarL family, response regulator DevR